MIKNTSKRGFTLIELLVVIAIIGILASVVLASLNSARSKGADAAIKSNLNNARAQAELYYDSQTPNSYAGVCAAATGGILNMKNNALLSAGSGNVLCGDTAAGWAMSALLKSGGYYCVDSTGKAASSSAFGIVDGASSSDVTCN